MGMFDLSGMIDKLAEAPPVQEAIQNLVQIKNNHANSMIRMDQRFDSIESKVDRLLELLEKHVLDGQSKMVPAAEDGLLRLLSTASPVLVCPVDGCTNTAVHGHPELSSTASYQVPIPDEKVA